MNRMYMRFRMLSSLMLLLLVAVLPLVAQNGYANSVAVGGGDVFVLKPRAGQGPATVYVYRMSADGTWQVAESCVPPAVTLPARRSVRP